MVFSILLFSFPLQLFFILLHLLIFLRPYLPILVLTVLLDSPILIVSLLIPFTFIPLFFNLLLSFFFLLNFTVIPFLSIFLDLIDLFTSITTLTLSYSLILILFYHFIFFPAYPFLIFSIVLIISFFLPIIFIFFFTNSLTFVFLTIPFRVFSPSIFFLSQIFEFNHLSFRFQS